MEIFDFSLEEYNRCNETIFRGRRRYLCIMMLVAVLTIGLGTYCALYADSIDFAFTVMVGCILSVTIMGLFAGSAFMSADYFEYKNIFYVIYEQKLYKGTMIPRVLFGGYEEISDFRRFVFLLFGRDIFYFSSMDMTSFYGPTREDVLRNFPHFITNDNFETVKVECLGPMYECVDRGDSYVVRTDTRLVSIKKYYTNLNRLAGCVIINRFFKT